MQLEADLAGDQAGHHSQPYTSLQRQPRFGPSYKGIVKHLTWLGWGTAHHGSRYPQDQAVSGLGLHLEGAVPRQGVLPELLCQRAARMEEVSPSL